MPSSTMIAAPDPSSPYLALDDYHAYRSRQDRHLATEFSSLQASIDRIKDELKEFKDDVGRQFKDVNSRFDRLEDNVRENFHRLEAESRRSYAYFRNSSLENPILQIQPLVDRPRQGILEPKPSYFPRHARDFYALKDPKTPHQFRTLLYLISFYDVELPHSAQSSDDDDDDSSADDEPRIPRPDLVVEALENVLGLNEQIFIGFATRANQHANRPSSHPIKRSQLPELNQEANTRKRTIPYRDLIQASPGFSDSLDKSQPTIPSSDGLTTGNVI